MSADNFLKFLNDHLPNDEAGQKELAQHKHDTNNFVNTLVDLGKKAGFDFTAQEALDLLPSADDNTEALKREADGELTDDDLAAVAGGASGISFNSGNLSSTGFKTKFGSLGGFGGTDLTGGGLSNMSTVMCCW